jgi:hypothetical protein
MKNALLWKRILNEGFNGLGQFENTEKIEHDIVTSPIIVDTRFGEIADGGWKKEFERLAMPFPKFWIEGDSEADDTPESKGARWGALVHNRDEGNGKFGIVVLGFAGSSQFHPLCFGVAIATLPNDAEGGTPWNVIGPRNKEHGTGIAVREILLYVFDCLELLSCKNVSLSPRDNDPKQVRRAVKRHGGKPEDYRYHVLVVRPPGASHDSPGQEIGIMPRHICRGHFAEYGAEFNKGLLFGRYSGRFYIPPHLKGKLEHGIVEKDYAIKPLVIVPDAQPGKEPNA